MKSLNSNQCKRTSQPLQTIYDVYEATISFKNSFWTGKIGAKQAISPIPTMFTRFSGFKRSQNFYKQFSLFLCRLLSPTLTTFYSLVLVFSSTIRRMMRALLLCVCVGCPVKILVPVGIFIHNLISTCARAFIFGI